jgi:hypothetical protein
MATLSDAVEELSLYGGHIYREEWDDGVPPITLDDINSDDWVHEMADENENENEEVLEEGEAEGVEPELESDNDGVEVEPEPED